MLESIFTAENLIALLTLTALEIVLGIDNIVVIAILSAKLKPELQSRARRIGLGLAMGLRILLLLSISWLMGLTEPMFALFGHGFSGRDMILLVGGLFLIAKATYEIHASLEGGHAQGPMKGPASFGGVIAQILALDLVFSLDSVITAVGLARALWVMITAIVIAVGAMMVFANSLSNFIHNHPTIKMLALAFLLLIGVLLTAEGLGRHIEKGYIYFAMGFSLIVELLNLKLLQKRQHLANVRV